MPVVQYVKQLLKFWCFEKLAWKSKSHFYTLAQSECHIDHHKKYERNTYTADRKRCVLRQIVVKWKGEVTLPAWKTVSLRAGSQTPLMLSKDLYPVTVTCITSTSRRASQHALVSWSYIYNLLPDMYSVSSIYVTQQRAKYFTVYRINYWRILLQNN